MSQANYKSDSTFCDTNQSSAEFFWRFQSGQYVDAYVFGEIGLNARGGSAGSYIPNDVIDISSFLDGRGTVLSRCNPPIPSLDIVNRQNFEQMKTNSYYSEAESKSAEGNDSDTMHTANGSVAQIKLSPELLLQKFTKEKKSSVALDSIDFNRYNSGLMVDPQNLRTVIEDVWAQRGGLDTQNFVKSSWSNQNNVPDFDKSMCNYALSPGFFCPTDYCGPVNGTTRVASMPGKPPGQDDYPFTDITSQQVMKVGASQCADQVFSGIRFDQGSCPPSVPQVFKENPYV